jgi:ATP phosphoribosyltransferase regulatory subunit
MLRKPEIRAEAARLMEVFRQAGAVEVEADILQPAEALLDLYGEDIRARAYVTADPQRGEQMLRPDFTVPLVQMHMSDGAEPARYTYAGEIFRKQENGAGRASEYMQVGYEIFDRGDPAEADAEAFALINDALGGLPRRAVTGDIGILKAAVDGLRTSERRKNALRRHIWRPARFRALLDRYSGKSPVPPSRAALLERTDADLFDGTGPLIGLRGEDEIRARVAALRADAQEPPIATEETETLGRLLSLNEDCAAALPALRALCEGREGLTRAVSRFEARLEALARRGIDVASLVFEGSHGRSTMEYYDGFTFAFSSTEDPALPPLATGGRYDALTGVLGQGRTIPAVGGVIRPGLTLRLREGA